jgi:hypothetical protein
MTKYRVQVLDATGTGFGPNNLVAELERAKNVGWADYLNDVPEAFFTLSQDDPKVSRIRTYRNNAHVHIYRDDDLVWRGWLGEWDANERDVIFYAYGEVGKFYFTHTDWNVSYTNPQINTIINDELTYSKALTNSLTAYISTGTIQAPVTTSGGATPIVIPTYKMFWKRHLHLFRELAALSVGNTTNSVIFEVDINGAFNFWKNKGTDTNRRFEYGDGRVSGFTESHAMMERRNQVNAAGMNPGDVLLRKTITGTTNLIGLRQEPIFFSWVRDQTELDFVTKFRGAMLDRDVPDITMQFHPGAYIPTPATSAPARLGDRIRAVIDRGITQVDGDYLVRGQQVFWVRGSERVNLMLEERPGT